MRGISRFGDESKIFSESSWQVFAVGLKGGTLFENGEREFINFRNQMSGNPVRIRSGCATVTGYELPRATELFMLNDSREGGSEVKPEVRIPV